MSVFKRKGSPFYYIEFLFRGRRVSRSARTSSRREAETFERRLRDEIARETRHLPVTPSLTLDQACGRYWKEHGHKLRWSGEVARHLKLICTHLDRTMPFAELSNKDVNQLVQARELDGAGPAGVNRTLAVLQGVHSRATARWESPTKAVAWRMHKLKEPKGTIRFITIEDARRLIAALPVHSALIVRFLLATGLRREEVLSLTWSDVEFATSHVRVLAKGGIRRLVPIEGEALLVLHEAPRAGRYVFDRKNFRRHWEAARKAAGLGNLRVHDLRHTHATWLRQQGAPLEVVKVALGHSSVAVTQKYAHVVEAEVRAALQGLTALTNGSASVVQLTPSKAKK